MKRRTRCRPLFVLVCAAFVLGGRARPAQSLGNPARVSAADTSSSDEGLIERISRPKLEAFGFVYLPKVSYGTDTGVGVGGHVLRPFSWRNGTADSEVDIDGRVTHKGQGEAGLTLNLGWGAGRYSVKTKVEFTNIVHRFYGIGPDTPDAAKEVFERQSLLSYLELIRRVATHVRVGVRGEFEDSKMLVTEPDGLFQTQSIRGVEASGVIGWGVLADWDSRDDRYWPATGSYHQTFLMKFDDGVGSDFDFDVYYLDLRRYFSTAPGHVLALQAFMYATEGAPPFWRMAELGGRPHSRGYRRGRYRDRVLVAFQAEHRFAVWRRLGLVGFVGLGDVASRLGDLQFEHMRLSVGGGVRFRVSRGGNRINARLDAAYGDEVRLYFTLGEAF